MITIKAIETQALGAFTCLLAACETYWTNSIYAHFEVSEGDQQDFAETLKRLASENGALAHIEKINNTIVAVTLDIDLNSGEDYDYPF